MVDAKYKNYSVKKISKEDIWQIAGYARLNNVYKLLGKNQEDNQNIKCLFIYPEIESREDISEVDLTDDKYLRKKYRDIYGIGISLPTIK